MATENALKSIPYAASSDLSALQYTFVKMSGDYAVTGTPTVNGPDAVGILQNNPIATAAAAVAVNGQSKVKLGATLTAGAKVTCSAAGLAIAATTGATILGTLIEGGASGNIGAMVLENKGVSA